MKSALLVSVLPLMNACVVHEAMPAFRAAVVLGDRGISIPLPPPSVITAPQQEVNVAGEVVGVESSLVDGWTVHVVDEVGGEALEVELMAGVLNFQAEGLSVDVTDHCLSLWVEDAEGNEAQSQQYRAQIDDPSGSMLTVVEGCS